MRIAMGPVLFNWPAETWRDFHFRIADEADVDIVHLGEVVCAKRQPFFAPHLAEVAERLTAAGKRVTFSTLALVMNRNERALVEAVCAMADEGAEVEVNDLSALARLAGREFAVGPFVNVYGEMTVAWLAGRGARRICLPPELGAAEIATLAGAMHAAGVAPEVMVFGRMPLALSARCYHARAHDLPKDGCQFVCGEDADGLDLDTLDGERFLAVNGIQTMSHACLNLIAEVPRLAADGVEVLRLSPQAAADMVAVAALFRAVATEGMAAAEAAARLAEMDLPFPFANGYYHGRPGAVRLDAATLP